MTAAVDHEAAVAKLLADLGGTADAVADRLRALDIKGQRSDPCECPIARYVVLHSGIKGLVASTIQTRVNLLHVDKHPIRVKTPLAVCEFIGRFDRGVYLDLAEVAR